MTKENIHPVIQLRICCQDSRWMSEYWWSWKLRRVPFSTSLQWRMGWGEGRAYAGFPWRGTVCNIQNPSVLCRVSKGDQSHFEAVGASFVCERCEVLPKWLCQFFKTHLQLTLGACASSVFGVQILRHIMIESGPLTEPLARIPPQTWYYTLDRFTNKESTKKSERKCMKCKKGNVQ